jgi:hypothetical protein
MKNFLKTSLILLISFAVQVSFAADKPALLKPFMLAQQKTGTKLHLVAAEVRKSLQSAGFDIAGIYIPDSHSEVIIFTDKAVLDTAAQTPYGGFGAALRASITQVGTGIQVATTNPEYMALAYQMKNRLKSTREKLIKTLGYIKDFGGEGIAESELPQYHYAYGLEGFTGFMELAEFKTHQQALAMVEKGLDRKFKQISKVYRIDIPGKAQSIFGLSLNNDVKDEKFLSDKYVMSVIDHKELRRSAHLPYEIMVTGNRVIMLHPHFRLAMNFPDLHMFGANSFGKLMNLPYIYEEFFVQMVGGQWPRP